MQHLKVAVSRNFAKFSDRELETKLSDRLKELFKTMKAGVFQ